MYFQPIDLYVFSVEQMETSSAAQHSPLAGEGEWHKSWMLSRRNMAECTPPKFNIAPEKMVGKEDKPFLLERPIFRGYVA